MHERTKNYLPAVSNPNMCTPMSYAGSAPVESTAIHYIFRWPVNNKLLCYLILPLYQNTCCHMLFLQLWPFVLLKKFASTVYFICYMLYYCMYFKLDLSFYMFAIFFWIRRMVKVARKNQWRQYFDTEGVLYCSSIIFGCAEKKIIIVCLHWEEE
jgi:hypothetical protein